MTYVADAAQGKEADKINVHHLPTTTRGSRNRGSKDVDAEQAGSSPKDCQVSSLRHRQEVTTHQQRPCSTLSSGLQITTCVIRAGLALNMVTLPSRAHKNGKRQTIKKLLPAKMHRDTSTRDGMHASKGNTNTCSRDFDGVGQRNH